MLGTLYFLLGTPLFSQEVTALTHKDFTEDSLGDHGRRDRHVIIRNKDFQHIRIDSINLVGMTVVQLEALLGPPNERSVITPGLKRKQKRPQSFFYYLSKNGEATLVIYFCNGVVEQTGLEMRCG